MKSSLIALLLILSMPIFAQQDSLFYETGELMNISYYHDNGVLKTKLYFHKDGNLSGEYIYDTGGVLLNSFSLNSDGDTISRSNVPLFNAQPKTDLSHIKWKKKKSGISIFLEVKGKRNKIEIGDSLNIWYIGYFEDGSQFDNSAITNKTLNLRFEHDMLIEGFEKGLTYFRDGSTGYIFIPYNLAYGDKAVGNIPKKSNLIYYIKPKIKK